MAHASTREKGKLMMEKYRAGKKKKQRILGQMSDEERKTYFEVRTAPIPMDQELGRMMYDFELNQLPQAMHSKFKTLLDTRLKYIIDEKKTEIFKIEMQKIFAAQTKLMVVKNGRK